ncbi:hypothetical protein ACHAW5_002190 [Stephanodiscus triporus]|uniref:Helicase-associated domain-containing protein n=1 Tax=Stephanodiscus triporus TaxID=2934178 RepID=A0ABD3NFF6_9STRA
MLKFKNETGHCKVPQHFPENPRLGRWVQNQCQQCRFYTEGKHSSITEERINILKAVGFVWRITRTRPTDLLNGNTST